MQMSYHPWTDLNFAFILSCGLASIFLAVALARQLGLRRPGLAGVALGLQPIFLYWSFGGLDSALAAVCYLLFLRGVSGFLDGGRPWGLAAGAVLVAAVRPEGALVAGCGLALAALPALLRRTEGGGRGLRGLAAAMGWILLAAVGIAGWRIWHSGHWVPQPVVAKAGGWGWWKAREGLRYLYHATLRNPGLGILWMGLAASVARLARRRPAEPLLLLATALAVSGLGFVLLSGGDWMENGRFIVPFVPLLVLLVVAGLERLPAAPGRRR
jgi:hypothetical protein